MDRILLGFIMYTHHSLEEKKEIIRLHELGASMSELMKRYHVRDHYLYILFGRYEAEKKRICEIFHESKCRYGYRRIIMQLHNEGLTINHKTVERLMKEQGLKCLIRKKRYRSYKGTIGKIDPNILNRDFKADRPYQKLVTDVSQIAIGDKKSFLSPILDLFNGEVLGYDISDRADLTQINNLKEHIDWYNNNRIKMKLKGMNPVQYRAQYLRE